MKTLIIMLVCIGIAQAQSVNPSHSIGRVDGDHENSSEYLARTPYTLHWAVDPKYKLYGKQDPTVKVESYLAGIHVYDVPTGRMIASVGSSPLNGSMQVSVSGRHRIKVFSTAAINLSFDEDKTALETAARRGELKDGITLDAAKASSARTKNDEIEALKEQIMARHEAQRKIIGEEELAGIRRDAELAAQLAANVDDFQKRFDTLILARVQNMKAPVDVRRVENSTPKTAPTWSGTGMPPGMQRAAKPASQPRGDGP